MKFAYLIMAHDNQEQLIILLRLLDHAQNDIYLHIDKKSVEMEQDKIRDSVHKAQLHIYSKYDVRWGGLSLTRAECFLLSEAVKTYHDYYHLLSGYDLPIKSNEQIQKFFAENNGKEFIHFNTDDYCAEENCRYYYFGNNRITNFLVKIQKKLGVRRKLYCGANWYSITHKLAVDLSNHSALMLRKLRWTRCSDESILQTFVKDYTKNTYTLYRHTENPDDYKSVARLIDWSRGDSRHPYVWKKSDFDEIVNSDRMFARKFDMKVDYEIIHMIEKYLIV